LILTSIQSVKQLTYNLSVYGLYQLSVHLSVCVVRDSICLRVVYALGFIFFLINAAPVKLCFHCIFYHNVLQRARSEPIDLYAKTFIYRRYSSNYVVNTHWLIIASRINHSRTTNFYLKVAYIWNCNDVHSILDPQLTFQLFLLKKHSLSHPR
jgi:hypothetical protein